MCFTFGLHLLYIPWVLMAVLWLKTLHRGGKGLNIGFEGVCLACVGFLLMGLYVCGFFERRCEIITLIFFQISIIWYICRRKRCDMAKVIHVHLLHNIDGTRRKDWYFSSITAVYTVLTAEQVGATKNYLLHAGLAGNGTVCTKKAIIKQSEQGLGRQYNAVRSDFGRYFQEC